MIYRLLITIVILTSACKSPRGDQLLSIDFEESFDKYQYFKLSELVEIKTTDSPINNKALRVTYVAYPKGSRRVSSRIKLASKVQSATLSFDVCFENDFQWVKGGKLHGLAPDNPVTGGNKRKPIGWSARILFKEDGMLQNYLYDQNYDLTYGFGSKSKKKILKKGTWHTITMQLRLNNKDKNDGFSIIYVDGIRVVENTDISFRSNFTKQSSISEFLFSTFHGGNSEIFAPKNINGYVNVHAWFDNIKVIRGINMPQKTTTLFSC
ncbi:polysaccharide lyase [Pseudocolwellia sp. AS88]|uniref:polysaccharide lyase n=1 Tax=Pseudocolwellia sp. AS88 TaxID=3063958 RepID=UPI0026EE1F65|nr:hypothetical protein [Pseudocolwellia sp. AS88]MDO7086716.1 hypothetical protein [Pseudocolwellia sp. AS88]